MQIRFDCPTDRCVALIELEPLEESGATITCPRCATPHPIQLSKSLIGTSIVDQCALCGSRELFIRKDFPQRFGLFVVVVFGLTAIYMFRTSVVAGWSVLGAGLLLDLAIYAFLGKVTTCYACRAQYRKGHQNPAHQGFDLATSEKY